MPSGIVPAPGTPSFRRHDPWEFTHILTAEDALCPSCGSVGSVIPGRALEASYRFSCACGAQWGNPTTWPEDGARYARDAALGLGLEE